VYAGTSSTTFTPVAGNVTAAATANVTVSLNGSSQTAPIALAPSSSGSQ
jgi:hypothetical protein